MKTYKRVVLSFLALFFAFHAKSSAETVYVGVFSFDTLIPAAGLDPGVNIFTVSNLTGHPTLGGFALPPDFPVGTQLTFLNSKVELTFFDLSTQLITIGDIGPGSTVSPLLQFSTTIQFTSAVFSAQLNQSNLIILGGGMFLAQTGDFTATLSPSAGPSLTAGNDLVALGVPTATTVPEPAGFAPVGLSILLLVCIARWWRT